MNDKMTFATELTGSFEMRGKDAPSNAVLGRWWSLVGHFPIAHVVSAIREHDRTNKFLPQPADVIAILESMDGRPGPDEAWGMALKSIDDAATVVWTDDVALAMGACNEQLMLGDKIAARVAFKEKYVQIVHEARANVVPIRWIVSYGDNAKGREDAIRIGVESRKLPPSYLESLPVPDSGRISGMIAGNVKKTGKKAFDENMAKIRERMARSREPVENNAAKIERERVAKLKAETEKLIEEKAGKLQGESK